MQITTDRRAAFRGTPDQRVHARGDAVATPPGSASFETPRAQPGDRAQRAVSNRSTHVAAEQTPVATARRGFLYTNAAAVLAAVGTTVLLACLRAASIAVEARFAESLWTTHGSELRGLGAVLVVAAAIGVIAGGAAPAHRPRPFWMILSLYAVFSAAGSLAVLTPGWA